MNIYVITQPGATVVRDISAHIVDYLDHRYSARHVATSVRPLAGQTLERSLALAQVVIVLIGPMGHLAADGSTIAQVRQALAQRKMIVPALLGGASLPAPTTPELAALAERQTIVIRPDPEMANDLNRLFAEVNTQLGWAPMSGAMVAVGALSLALALLYTALALAGEKQASVAVIFVYVPLEVLVLGGALWLAWRRRARWWGALIVASLIGAAMAALGTIPLPDWLAIALYCAYPVAQLLFGLLGPRRELERLAPPRRVRLPASGRLSARRAG